MLPLCSMFQRSAIHPGSHTLTTVHTNTVKPPRGQQQPTSTNSARTHTLYITMADICASLSRDTCDVASGSPKEKDQARRAARQGDFGDKQAHVKTALQFAPQLAVVPAVAADPDVASALVVQLSPDQHEARVSTDPDAAYNASLAACYRAQSRFSRWVSHRPTPPVEIHIHVT